PRPFPGVLVRGQTLLGRGIVQDGPIPVVLDDLPPELVLVPHHISERTPWLVCCRASRVGRRGAPSQPCAECVRLNSSDSSKIRWASLSRVATWKLSCSTVSPTSREDTVARMIRAELGSKTWSVSERKILIGAV